MIPKTMLEWRQENACLEAGRRLQANADFQLLVRTLEGFTLMQRGLMEKHPGIPGSTSPTEFDIARKYGEGVGHSQFLQFIYTMGTLYKPPVTQEVPVTFTPDKRKPGG